MKFLKQLIYTLKRDYGRQITYFRVTGSTSIDYINNTSITPTSSTVIKKAILLPKRTTLDNYIVFPKSSLGYFTKNIQQIIIDGKDIAFDPQIQDYMEFDSRRYNIKEAITLDRRSGFLIYAESVPAEPTTPYSFSDNLVTE